MLRGKKILITSGPTRMPLDAMRFLSNRSTGRFGTLLAKEALKRGAHVTFIYGVGSEIPKVAPVGVGHLRCMPVETNTQAAAILQRELKKFHYDAVIHAMAVLDFQPKMFRRGKIKTKIKIGIKIKENRWKLELVPTPKIINQIKKWAPKTFLVGFKLEVGITKNELLKRARNLLKSSRSDLVLANQLTQGEDRKHFGWLLNSRGKLIKKVRGKTQLSRLVLRELEKRI